MYRFTYILKDSNRKLKLKKDVHLNPPLNLYSKKPKPFLLEKALYLDTETSHNHNKNNRIGWVYSWCCEFNDEIIIGRTPKDFIKVLKQIKVFYELNEIKHIVIYVHNLSYDIQYLKNFLMVEFGTNYTMLAVNNHKFITFSIDVFDFRCSYKMSNLSLDKWGKSVASAHLKLNGAIDYNEINYQDTVLDKAQFTYLIADVLTLKDCVNTNLLKYNDTLQSVPLTSTSYIRRDLRNYIRRNDRMYMRNFNKLKLTLEQFNNLMLAYSGGYTHANRFLKAQTVHKNIRHRDFRSHYPSQLQVSKYPMSQFSRYYNANNKASVNDVLKLSNEYCCIITIIIKDLKIKKGVTMPYAQTVKFYALNNKYIEDNGRILQMDGSKSVVLTELDLKILLSQYTFDYVIESVDVAKADYLPQILRDGISQYFRGKSDMKNIVEENIKKYGDFNEITLDSKYNLMKNKNGLNGIYGCMCTNPIRKEIKMNEHGEWKTEKITLKEQQEKLDSFYKNKKSFLHYQWGVWCCANARYELFEFINVIGYENCLYCDTDSIFYISTPEIEQKIENYNTIKYNNAIKIGAYITTNNNKIITYDNFSDENENITDFRALHSKCYAYITNNELHCTIAGVAQTNKKSGKDRVLREEELGSIDNLSDGKIFKECGGAIISYAEHETDVILINNHFIDYASAGIIEKSEKTLNDKDTIKDIEYLEIYKESDEV